MPLFCILIYRQQFVSLPYHKRLISLQVWYPSLCAVESWYACIWLKLVVKQSVTDYKVQDKTAQFKENLSHPRISMLIFPAEKFNLEVKKEDCIGNIQVLSWFLYPRYIVSKEDEGLRSFLFSLLQTVILGNTNIICQVVKSDTRLVWCEALPKTKSVRRKNLFCVFHQHKCSTSAFLTAMSVWWGRKPPWLTSFQLQKQKSQHCKSLKEYNYLKICYLNNLLRPYTLNSLVKHTTMSEGELIYLKKLHDQFILPQEYRESNSAR